MANTEKIPSAVRSEPGLWRMLVAFLTDPGCRQAFREGWKEGWNEAANKPVSVCETDDEKKDDGVLVPNALLQGTSYDNFSNPEIELNPYGFTKIN